MKTSKGKLSFLLVLTILAAFWKPNRVCAQAVEQQLYSFGQPGASSPEAPLIQGIDGTLYGTTYNGGTNGWGTVFRLSTNGGSYEVLYSFTGISGDGSNPSAGLIQGNDGMLYGTTYLGGTNNYGTVFKLSTNGSGYQVLYVFTGTNGDGANPSAALIQGSDGMLYSTTYLGGTTNFGTVFKLSTNGGGFEILHRFTVVGGDGTAPNAGVIQGKDGALYGTAGFGGADNYGAVFKLSTDGSNYQILYSFTGTGGDGTFPYGGLLQVGNGTLYGTTDSGGTKGAGTVYKLSTNGGGYQVVYNFTDTSGDGGNPQARLIQGGDGALYGTTEFGGTGGYGTIFKLSTNGGGDQVLYSSTGTGGDGAYPFPGLIQGGDGMLYGTTLSGGTNDWGTVFKLGTNGGNYDVLYLFTGASDDGTYPYGGLIQGSDGALYGTTYSGGTNGFWGTVFKLSTNASGYQILYSFTGAGGDGAGPQTGLTQGNDGALYGTTTYGGTNSNGTVFKLSTNGGGYQVLYRFTATGGDGAYPYANLVQGSDGALYGTTEGGGTNNSGTVFKINTNGQSYQILYNFRGTAGDGAYPYANLIQGSDGALYGTTFGGGTNGDGTVFKLSTNGDDYQVLYRFTEMGGDGANPRGGLVQGSDGALYGTAYYGGTYYYGIVFKLSTSGGGYQVLYSFTGTAGDGANPSAGLIQGNDSALFGTTIGGGIYSSGTVFRIGTNGSGYSVLSSLGNGGHGAVPQAGVVQGGDGTLYGTTGHGGNEGFGACFRLVTFVLLPPSQITLNGTNPVLSVVAEGVPPTSYTWLLNGVVLVGQTNSTLTLDGIQAPLQGVYTIIVSNSFGLSTNVMAKLSVTATNSYYYDQNDRLIGAQYGNGISIAYNYDGNGNLVRQTYLSRVYETNGLPVLWRFLNGLSPTNNSGTNGPYGDADGNGWSNLEKWQLGLNPLDPASVPNLKGIGGTNLGTISLPFTPSNFVAAVGQLDVYGGPTIVVGADGNPGTNVNFLELFSESYNGWSEQQISIGPFGITSIAVGQPTNRPTPCIYLGLRQASGDGLIVELQNSDGGWQMNTIATSTTNSAYVLGVRPGYDVMASMAATNTGNGTLYSLLFPTNQWVVRLFDTNVSTGSLGTVLLDGSYSPGTLRLLSPESIQIDSGDSTNSSGTLLNLSEPPFSIFVNWLGPGLSYGIPRGANNDAASIYYLLGNERLLRRDDYIENFILAEFLFNGTNVTETNVTQLPITNSFLVPSDDIALPYGLASANYLNTTNEVLFTGDPDGTVYSWIATNNTGPLQAQLFSSQYAGTLWHALIRVPTLEPGQGIAGLNVNPASASNCNVILWPPQQTLYSPPNIPQTTVAATLLSQSNAIGGLIDVPIILSDTVGNPCSVSLLFQYSNGPSTPATISLVDSSPYISGTRIAAWPGGSSHVLAWNAQADLGLVSTNVWLSFQAQDVTGSQGYSAQVMYQVDTVPLLFTTALTNLYLGTDGFHFDVSGLQGLFYPAIIEASTDLLHWIPILTNQSTSNLVPFVDNGATNFKARFYRLETQ